MFATFCNSNAQTDTIAKTGTIRIVKPKDSIYIKAYAEFKVFEPKEFKATNNQIALESIFDSMQLATNPNYKNPLTILNKKDTINYSKFFNENINRNELQLGDKVSDTVKIRIDITREGLVYCRELDTQIKISNKRIKYNKSLDSFKNFKQSSNYKSMQALNSISEWQPAKAFVSVQKNSEITNDSLVNEVKKRETQARTGKEGKLSYSFVKRKGRLFKTKPKLENTNSSGIITIIFSKEEIVE